MRLVCMAPLTLAMTTMKGLTFHMYVLVVFIKGLYLSSFICMASTSYLSCVCQGEFNEFDGLLRCRYWHTILFICGALYVHDIRSSFCEAFTLSSVAGAVCTLVSMATWCCLSGCCVGYQY